MGTEFGAYSYIDGIFAAPAEAARIAETASVTSTTETTQAKTNTTASSEAKPTSSPLGRQDEHPSGYDNPLTMDRILQLAHVLCKCPPEYRSSWSCDPCRAFAELIFFRQSAATPVSVGGEDKKKNSNSSVK